MNQPVFTTLGCSKLCWCLLHQHIRPTSHIVLSQKQLWHLATRCRYVEHLEEYCQLFHPWFGGRCCSVLSRCRPTVLCMSHNARYRPTLTPFNRPSSTIHVFISDVSGKTNFRFCSHHICISAWQGTYIRFWRQWTGVGGTSLVTLIESLELPTTCTTTGDITTSAFASPRLYFR